MECFFFLIACVISRTVIYPSTVCINVHIKNMKSIKRAKKKKRCAKGGSLQRSTINAIPSLAPSHILLCALHQPSIISLVISGLWEHNGNNFPHVSISNASIDYMYCSLPLLECEDRNVQTGGGFLNRALFPVWFAI